MLALLLDIDGTLLDTFDAILEAMNVALAEFRVRPLTAEELRPLIGVPVEGQMKMLRDMEGPVVDAIADRYYEVFHGLVDRGLRPYPGVPETLARLAGRGTANWRPRLVNVVTHERTLRGACCRCSGGPLGYRNRRHTPADAGRRRASAGRVELDQLDLIDDHHLLDHHHDGPARDRSDDDSAGSSDGHPAHRASNRPYHSAHRISGTADPHDDAS